jgi:long-chain fatty acid transport protein
VFDRVRLTYPETPDLDRWIAQDYEDVLQGRLGIEYLLSETWALRAGYSYDRSPQPTETIGPFLHDEDRHGFGLGATWKYENVKLDLMGRYLLFSSRSTDGLSISGFEGLYETSGFQLGVALGYRF